MILTTRAEELAEKMKQSRAALLTALEYLHEEIAEDTHAAELLDVCELAARDYSRTEEELRELAAMLEEGKL